MERAKYGWAGWAVFYALCWTAAVAWGGQIAQALPLAIVAGGVLPAIAWLFTRKTEPVAITVERPVLEMAAIGIWLVIYAVVVLGWLFTLIKQQLPPSTREYALVMLGVKLAIHVVIPVLILKAVGARIMPLIAPRLGARGVPATLVVLGVLLLGITCLVTPALKNIAGAHASIVTLGWAIPFSFVWLAVEAGVCEEFLFRVVLQTRLAAVLRSEAGAVVIAALLFGLAHVPGLYLRPDTSNDMISGGLAGVIAYAVGTLSPIGILFGVLWARTRSFGLIVLLHATIDTLPNVPDMLRLWG